MTRRLAGPWLLLLGAASCEPEASRAPTPLTVAVPENLGREVVSPERNPLTVEGAALGKRLFFDPLLSGKNDVACASCHDPARAYTDFAVTSRGESGVPLSRNAPSLINVAFKTGYFWDGGAKDLESQVFGPLAGPDEMGQSTPELLAELAADPSYVEAFQRAFPDGLRLANIARALAQFERTLVSASSRYDRVVRGEPGAQLGPAEERGRALFGERCASCHASELFTDDGYHNSGLDDRFPEDHERIAWGRGRITRVRADIGKYKTPSLRNVAATAPYMHDGRFATLAQVVDHYRFGIQPSASLDPALDVAALFALTDDDAACLVAFLGTLTDEPRELEGRGEGDREEDCAPGKLGPAYLGGGL